MYVSLQEHDNSDIEVICHVRRSSSAIFTARRRPIARSNSSNGDSIVLNCATKPFHWMVEWCACVLDKPEEQLVRQPLLPDLLRRHLLPSATLVALTFALAARLASKALWPCPRLCWSAQCWCSIWRTSRCGKAYQWVWHYVIYKCSCDRTGRSKHECYCCGTRPQCNTGRSRQTLTSADVWGL